jgi:small nuclear ribonucleoprotein
MSEEGIASQVLQENVGKSVLVKLKGRKIIRGKLKSFDKQMNLLLEEAIDISEQHTGEKQSEVQMGDILVRCDNVIIISVV